MVEQAQSPISVSLLWRRVQDDLGTSSWDRAPPRPPLGTG